MKPTTVSVTGTGVSDPIVTDYMVSPFNIGMGIVVDGTVTYTIQHTFDDPFSPDFDPSTATWFPHEDLVAQTTSQDGNYAFPMRAARLNVSLGDGTATLTLIQAGVR